MNILLGALILALLLLPGFIFRMGYLAKPFASKSFNSSFVEELLFSLLPAFIIQVCGYLIVEHFKGVNERTFLLLIINSDKSVLHNFTGGEIGLFALYLLVVCGCAVALGFGLRYIALRTRLHLQYSLFRIYNEWQIYFDGFILDYPDEPGERKDVMQKWLDVLVENKNGSYIYSGFLNEYVLAKDDTLSRIYLTAVRRRRLEDDLVEPADNGDHSPEGVGESEVNYDEPNAAANQKNVQLDKRYYFMPGDYFMIPGSEIKSINITYYTGELTEVA
jgi:hypothetical protein